MTNKLCCLLSGEYKCASCDKSICMKHIRGLYGHFSFAHKVQRCLQCHRKFVQIHRTGSAKMISRATWFNQVARRQAKQNKSVIERLIETWPF